MMRTKGEAGTGNIVEAVRHLRTLRTYIRKLTTLSTDELMTEAKNLGAPFDIVQYVAAEGKLLYLTSQLAAWQHQPMQPSAWSSAQRLSSLESGIFMSEDPAVRAKAMVEAVTHWQEPESSPKFAMASAKR